MKTLLYTHFDKDFNVVPTELFEILLKNIYQNIVPNGTNLIKRDRQYQKILIQQWCKAKKIKTRVNQVAAVR